MSVDRGWMERRVNPIGGSVTQEFENGVKGFLKFAYNHPQFVTKGTIKCPCSQCALSKFLDRQTVKLHLLNWGFQSLYTRWYEHGELLKSETIEHNVSNDQQSQQKDCDRYYEAKLTYRGKIVVATQILGRLTKNQLALFRTTCFGSWLAVQHTGGDPMLTHLILQTQVFHDPPTPDEMWFDIKGHKIRFSREEFCLVTGFRFGSDSLILPWVAGMSNNPFKDRMFPNIPSGQLVKLSDIVKVFDNIHPSVPMDDHDAVRICLLMLLQMGFLGRQPINNVRDELLMLVEDLDSWNLFPWGSYVWQFTFPQLSKAITQRHDSHAAPRPQGKLIKYTLIGFIWAFKIWILEAFPFALSNFQQDVGLIPRAISWKKIRSFSWEKCLNFLVVDERRPPLRTLTPTDAESQTEWWKASAKYFAGVDDQRQRPVKNKKARSPSPSRPPKKARSPSPPPSSQVQDICNLDHVPSALDGIDGCRMPTLDTTATYRVDCHTATTESTSYGVNHATISTSDTAPTYQQLLQRVATLEDTVKQLVQRVTALERPSHVDRDTVSEGAIPSTANLLARTNPIPSTVMPLREAEIREVEPGNRPSPIEIIENVHKRQKGKGEWHDSKAEKVAFNNYKKIKEKFVSEYETADDSGQPSDDPFDPRTWAEVICVPEKKKGNKAGCSPEADNTFNQNNSPSSTKGPPCNTLAPDGNGTESELESKATIEAEVKSRVEVARLQMKEQMEKQFKQLLESLR